MKTGKIAFVALAAAIMTTGAFAAETVHLHLKSNGEDIQGDSTVTSLNRANTIQCLSFQDTVATVRAAGSGMATGRRTYEPIVFRKRIDKSSPLLAKSLVMNQVVEGQFRFYRPSPAGDGTTEHFFTIEFKEGRVSGIKRLSPSTIEPATANQPPTEEVSIVFNTITWRYLPTGATFTDSVSANRSGAAIATAPAARPAIVRPPTQPIAGSLMAMAFGLGIVREY
ncbi:MAG TPA: type VI secretion system tube protein TssD [Fimbriimonadaceae bacterium]|nr:type VI secretion system tube protein TssD [Fimbriimonadaceae bacterium]